MWPIQEIVKVLAELDDIRCQQQPMSIKRRQSREQGKYLNRGIAGIVSLNFKESDEGPSFS